MFTRSDHPNEGKRSRGDRIWAGLIYPGILALGSVISLVRSISSRAENPTPTNLFLIIASAALLLACIATVFMLRRHFIKKNGSWFGS